MKSKLIYVSTDKLTKPMKIAWRHYRDIIDSAFTNKYNQCMKNGVLDFSLFIPIDPQYTNTFMSRIRKMLSKKSYGLGEVEIKHHIKPEEDKKLGILIKYKAI